MRTLRETVSPDVIEAITHHAGDAPDLLTVDGTLGCHAAFLRAIIR